MIISYAEAATIDSLVNAVNKVVVNPLIIFIFALALVIFIYGVAQYLLNPESEEVRKQSKSHMIWGVVGMFIMVSVFGIMRIILNTIGEDKKIKIQNTGEITVEPIKLGK